jgi:hypothetical protein
VVAGSVVGAEPGVGVDAGAGADNLFTPFNSELETPFTGLESFSSGVETTGVCSGLGDGGLACSSGLAATGGVGVSGLGSGLGAATGFGSCLATAAGLESGLDAAAGLEEYLVSDKSLNILLSME